MLKTLKRRLRRLNAQLEELLKEHQGNEEKFTYHGGHRAGYLKGKIVEIEDFIDYLEEIEEL